MNDCISFKRPSLDDSCQQIGEPSNSSYWRAIGPVLLVMVAATALRAEQPIAYSHKIHIEHGLQCLDCHSGAGTRVRAAMTIQALQSMLDVYFMRVRDGLFSTQRGRGDHDQQNRPDSTPIAGIRRFADLLARIVEAWPFEANTVVHGLRAGNSHYQNWCLGAPALSGPNLSLTMLPHQRLKPAAPAYSLSP